MSASPEELRQSPVEERPVGLEALEALHNQIQILVKRDCPEETQLTNLHNAVIASLRHQVDEMQQTLEFLRTSDHTLLCLSLRDSEQRTHEAEVKLTKATERSQRLKVKLVRMQHKYQLLLAEKSLAHQTPPPPTLPSTLQAKAGSYYSPEVQCGLKKAAVSERGGLTASYSTKICISSGN